MMAFSDCGSQQGTYSKPIVICSHSNFCKEGEADCPHKAPHKIKYRQSDYVGCDPCVCRLTGYRVQCKQEL
ncbi:hypothetical protein LCGC14_0819770 [marine sediment metagenome]|uniref:Uncharacterized protein n=1 Tax=marine sediment metagenome TaxID=412755 RepID=A0A0F9SRT4_9ZZZZ